MAALPRPRDEALEQIPVRAPDVEEIRVPVDRLEDGPALRAPSLRTAAKSGLADRVVVSEVSFFEDTPRVGEPAVERLAFHRPRQRSWSKGLIARPECPPVDALAASFVEDLKCAVADGARLAALARERRITFGGTSEDGDEDLGVRLLDPRGFGSFAGDLLGDSALGTDTRTALAERAFDLLPLPRREDEAFSVEARAPPNLLAFARHLVRTGAFTPLHLLHIVYAVFLDRSLVTAVDQDVRSAVLAHVAATASPDDRVSALYVSLHLSALEETEATAELRTLFESRITRWPFKRLVASVVAPDMRGVVAWVQLAQGEGLLPMGLDPQDPSIHANLPRMHAAFGPLVAARLEPQHDGPGPPGPRT